MTTSADLSEDEVRERLDLCEDPEVVNEIYNFGQTLEKASIDHIQILESKATSFAAYGAAIVTLLVSSSATWSQLGNEWTLWIAFCAGLSAVMCTYYSIRALSLKEFENISQDEWLKAECLLKLHTLKRYRILTLWGTIDSHDKIQSIKAKELKRAQVWLTGSVIFLLYLLFHIAFLRSLGKNFWIALWQCIRGNFRMPGWQRFLLCGFGGFGALGAWACILILGLTLALIFRHSRRI